MIKKGIILPDYCGMGSPFRDPKKRSILNIMAD